MSDKLKELYIKNSRLPKRYIDEAKTANLIPTTESDCESFEYLNKVKNNIVSFVKFHHNLLITSDHPGNGKTSWAAKIILHYIDSYAHEYSFKNNTPVLFINVPDFLMKKKIAISDKSVAEEMSEIEKAILTAKIVVFDDIATKVATDYDREILYSFINNRTDNYLTNIYTSNIFVYNLSEELGERIADRIIGYSKCVELTGAGMRGSVE
jgi:DNA replication protein DnaC